MKPSPGDWTRWKKLAAALLMSTLPYHIDFEKDPAPMFRAKAKWMLGPFFFAIPIGISSLSQSSRFRLKSAYIPA